jgi:4-amino-4-deoxy-L-arabinose transferase-like glycosyltransferase
MPGIKKIEKTGIFLLAILAIAAVVRYWGIDFGLPHTQCKPDEEFITNIIFSPSRSFHPGAFNYPSFYKYFLLVFYTFYFLLGMITGKYTSMIDCFTDYYINPTDFYLINRYLVAFLGTFTVFIVYRISRDLFNKKTAIISSLFLSLAYLHVRDSHFGCVDVPQTFFIMCAVLFTVRSYNEKTSKNYVLAGIFAGLATSTKYAGILSIAPMLAVHLFNILDLEGKKCKLFFNRPLLFFIVAFVGAFLLGTPFCLIDWSNFVSDFMFEMRHLAKGHYITLGIGWWYHLSFSLFYGLGWPLLMVSIAGIMILIKTNLKKAILLFSFPLIYYFSAGKGYTVFLRYMIPVIPFLCISAAIFTIYISEKLPGHFRPGIKDSLVFSLGLLILYPSICNAIHFNRLMAKKDNRLIATEWIYENLPAGSSVYQTGLYWGRLQLYPASSTSGNRYKEITVLANFNGKAFNVKINRGEKQNIPGYEEWKYNGKIGKFEFRNKLTSSLPRYIIVEESPLLVWTPIPPKRIKELIGNLYYLKKSFKAVDWDNTENLYEKQHAFYLPFTGFKDVSRPGPNIYVYEREQ